MIRRAAKLGILCGLAFITACGNTEAPKSSSELVHCDSQTAAILIWDGYAENYCGCEGSGQNGTKQTPPTALDCQVSNGKTVWFYLMGNATYHQVVSSNNPQSFSPSFVQVPESKHRAWAYPIVISQSSTTWSYQDQYNPTINGTISIP